MRSENGTFWWIGNGSLVFEAYRTDLRVIMCESTTLCSQGSEPCLRGDSRLFFEYKHTFFMYFYTFLHNNCYLLFGKKCQTLDRRMLTYVDILYIYYIYTREK